MAIAWGRGKCKRLAVPGGPRERQTKKAGPGPAFLARGDLLLGWFLRFARRRRCGGRGRLGGSLLGSGRRLFLSLLGLGLVDHTRGGGSGRFRAGARFAFL